MFAIFKKIKDKIRKILPFAAALSVLASVPAMAAEGGTANTFTGILGEATTMFAWFITEMTSLVSFILQNPLVLAMFMILLCGSVVAMFFRIWHNA